MSQQHLVDSMMMIQRESSYGNLTGAAAEKAGRMKDARGPSTEDNLFQNTINILESTNGQIGGCRSSSKRMCRHFGKKSSKNNILMTMKASLRSSEELEVTLEKMG
jgi:hypothetical protein